MYARRYGLYGALFGLLFPAGATLFQRFAEFRHLGFWQAVAAAQATPLLWLIDTAPVVLALVASFAGRRQDDLLAAERSGHETSGRTAGELFTAAQALLSTVSAFSSMASETAASVRETTATLGQLGHTATQAALTAETVIGLADSSQKSSAEGLAAAEISTAQQRSLAGDVRGLSEAIGRLAERLRDIFEIASVVDHVAERSQRLADAAHAEMERSPGARSFQPIVGEMRRHSEEAREAAVRVKAILGEVHQALEAAIGAAESGARRAEEGARVAASTGDAIRRLAEALRDSSLAAREIATVAQQQDHGIEQVLQAMNEIYLATQETMAATQQVAREARALNDIASGLRGSRS